MSAKTRGANRRPWELEMAKGGGGRGMGKKGLEEMMNDMPEIHQFLDGFYMAGRCGLDSFDP